MIDWSDGGCKISRHFTVRHAIWLPSWKRLATRDDGLNEDAKAALVQFFAIMDEVKGVLGLPIVVHCAFRPVEYNKLVGGAPSSMHIARRLASGALVAACDFSAELTGATPGGQACDRIRKRLLLDLDRLGLRMENKPESEWVHLDNKPAPGPGWRYFKP